MPISNSYPKGIPIEDQDLFVGTKAANNRTVNYTAQGVADYLNINSKVAIGGQMSFQFTIVPNIPKTIAFEGGLGNNTAFSAITKLIVSAIDLSTANITIFLNYLNNSQVLLSQQNQPNFFGHYKITGYTQIGTSAFYELDLEFIGGNGTIGDKQYYDLVSFVLSTEVPPTEWGSITGDIEDQTDLIDYISSQITTPTLQSVTDEGNETTNSIIVEDNTILIKDNYNTTYFEINGYELIGKDLTTNESYFQLGYDGQMYAFNPPTVSYIQSLHFNTNGVPFQDYEFPSKPAGNYTLATTSDITTPTLQQVTDAGNETTNDIIVSKETGTSFIQIANNDNTLTLQVEGAFGSLIELNDYSANRYGLINSSGLNFEEFGYSNINLRDGFLTIANASLKPYISLNGSDGTLTGSVEIKTDLVDGTYIQQLPDKSGTFAMLDDIPAAGVTSVGLTMPSAFSVTNSPITSSGDIAVTALGTASQYIRGDGQLATLPTGAGGGSTVAYYLNGSINASVAGYKQLSNTATIGGGTDFTLAGNGLIAQFLTDIGNPNRLEIPGGAWNFEMFFQASSGGGSQKFYVELLKYDGTTFTSIASSVSVAEEITGGTTIDLYLTSLAVPTTSLLVTDRLAIRVYIVDNSGGRTITLHTEDNTLCEIITTFSGGVTSLNGLSANTQYFAVGTGATNFNISSSVDTHTFNLLFNIRRNANNSSNNNINYNGYAVTGSSESSAVWTITRLTIAASGSITTATATNVAWTNRESATYI